MTSKERYNRYMDMFEEAQELQKQLEHELPNNYNKVYSVYVAVGDEEKELYFIDIEVGGSAQSYHRWKGLFTKDAIIKRFL